MDSDRLARITRRQLGLFTRSQAHHCGFSPSQVRNRLTNGSWIRVAGDVLGLPGVPVTAELRARAAQLAVTGSVIGGPSAARLWGMQVLPTTTFLIVPGRVGRKLPDVRLIVGAVGPREICLVEGVPVTSRPRTVFDCLWLLPEREALDLLDRALQRDWTTIDDLATRLHSFAGRHGARQVVRLVHTAASGTHSAAERLAVRILRESGLRGWAANEPLYDSAGLIGIVDIAFRGARLVIEVDGWSFHVTPDRFQRDRQRQNRLIQAGWTVLRFTWRDLTERPDQVIATIRATLRRMGALPN